MDSEGNADEYWTFEEIAFSCRQSGLQALPESDIGEQNCAVNNDSPQKSVRKEETRHTADTQQHYLTIQIRRKDDANVMRHQELKNLMQHYFHWCHPGLKLERKYLRYCLSSECDEFYM